MILVMSLIAEMTANGASMDYLPQMTMVFETLSKEFVPFKTTYSLTRKELTLSELMKELQEFERMLKKDSLPKEVHMVDASGSDPVLGKERRDKGRNLLVSNRKERTRRRRRQGTQRS